MPHSITLPDRLVRRLESTARYQHTTVDALVVRILDREVAESDDEWQSLNRRRVELIRRRFNSGIDEAESEELQRLQALADQHLDQLDAAMLQEVEDLCVSIEGAITPHSDQK